MLEFLKQFKHKTLIIAEIGTNHDGSLHKSKRMVAEAAAAGADAVKFQAYKTEKLVSSDLPVFSRARELGYKYQFDRFKDLEFNEQQFKELYDFSCEKGVIFLATAFDMQSADMIEPLVSAYKVASAELINIPLLQYLTKKNKPMIISTGQASEEEINRAVEVVRMDRVALLHCVSAYPTPDEQANLLSIPYLRSIYPNIPVGYSDHTVGISACIAATALGSTIIEKHFTLDRNRNCGDHPMSAIPSELKQMVSEIRRIEHMLGKPNIVCQEAEKMSRKQLRKVLMLTKDLEKGSVLKENMLIPLMSPTPGMYPNRLSDVVSRRAISELKAGHVLQEKDIA